MKRLSLLFASVMLAVVSVFAQPTKPTPPGEAINYLSWADAVKKGKVYLYNVDAKLFLTFGNNWGTHASLVTKQAVGGDNSTNGYTLEDLKAGTAIEGALLWEVKEVETGVYTFYQSSAVRNTNDKKPGFLFVDSYTGEATDEDVYVDGAADKVHNWFVKDLGNNTFQLGICYEGSKVEGSMIGAPYLTTTGVTTVVLVDNAEGAAATWAAVSEEEMTARSLYNWQLPVYETQLDLYNTIQKIKNKADVADYEPLSVAPLATTKEELDKQHTELKTALEKAKKVLALENADSASLTNPVDITAIIPYVMDLNSLESSNGVPPKHGWTSTKQQGNFHVNTWSKETELGSNTNITSPWLEYWRASAEGDLNDQVFYRDPEKDPFTLPAGAYRISANICMLNGRADGPGYVTGAYLFGNANRTGLVGEGTDQSNALEGAVYGTAGSGINYWKDSFEAYAIVSTDSLLKFGIQTEGANFNWIATRDWKVEYLGSEYDAIDKVRSTSELSAPKVDLAGVDYITKSLEEDYKNQDKYVETYKTSKDVKEILAAYSTIFSTADQLPANIAAWKAYAALVEKIAKDRITEEPTCEETEMLIEYAINANSAPATGEYNGNGTYAYIIGNLTLTTKEVEAETKWLDSLYSVALKKNMLPGMDVSSMLSHPKFDDGFTGWINKSTGSKVGGLTTFPSVEVYKGSIDTYQIVEGLPDGIYSLSCNIFERPDVTDNMDSWYTTAKTCLYMNDFQTNVNLILDGKLNIDDAEDGKNCYQTKNDDKSSGSDDLDNQVEIEGETYLVPNGMKGASYAFQAGRYQQKVYGLIEGGTMQIGLTSNGQTVHWALWSNFTLTYEGKTAEAIAAAIESLSDAVTKYRESANLSTGVNNALETAQGEAELSITTGEVDKMWAALIALNKLYAEAKEFEDVYSSFKVKAAELDYVWETLEEILDESPSAEKADIYGTLSDKIGASDNASLADIKALMKEIDKTIGTLRLPNDYSGASDNNPVDMTCTIVNPDFEASEDPEAEIGVLNPKFTYYDDESNEVTAELTGWTFNTKATGDTKVHNIYTNDEHIYTAGELNKYHFDASLKNGGEENNFVFNTWHGQDLGVDGFWLQQTVKSLPAGTYKLEADLATPGGGRVKLYINDKRMPYVTPEKEEADEDADADADEEETIEKEPQNFGVHAEHIYKLEEGADFVIKVASSTWFKADNFKLTYYGTESEFEPTEIEGVEADDAASAPVAIYTVAGAKVASLQKGINIVKYANGKVVKVLVK